MPEARASDGRERLAAALRTPWSGGQAVAGILLAVLGFGAAVQVRAAGTDDDFTGARQAELIALINGLAAETDRAEQEIRELQATRDSLRDDAEATRTALALAREQAETLGILAGTLPAAGDGVRITVDPGEGEIGTDQLLNGLQELRDAGAEAIELNDRVRVVAQTGLQDSPDGLLVGGVPLQPPYVLDVIGAPETLASAVDFSGGFRDTVEAVGGMVEVERPERVEVATTRELPESRFAEPVEAPEE
jgi:uncharacterized protein YlxW (UPF0749 family)